MVVNRTSKFAVSARELMTYRRCRDVVIQFLLELLLVFFKIIVLIFIYDFCRSVLDHIFFLRCNSTLILGNIQYLIYLFIALDQFFFQNAARGRLNPDVALGNEVVIGQLELLIRVRYLTLFNALRTKKKTFLVQNMVVFKIIHNICFLRIFDSN